MAPQGLPTTHHGGKPPECSSYVTVIHLLHSDQHLEVVQPCLPSEPELMTGGHLWQGTQSANKLGILHATRRLYQQVLVYGVC